MGARVDEIVAYQTLAATDEDSALVDALENNEVDMVTFTSSSTVSNFRSLLPAGEDLQALMKGAAVACIGPITADTAESLGFKVDITAKEFTIDGLCQAIVDYFTTATSP